MLTFILVLTYPIRGAECNTCIWLWICHEFECLFCNTLSLRLFFRESNKTPKL